MQKLQDKAFQLLKETDQICKRCNIKYYLGAPVIRQAINSGVIEGDMVNLEVLMPAGDVLKFIDYIEKNPREDRTIDYMGNYKDHTYYTVEYVDKTTTLILLNKGTDYSRYGVKVTIVPIRNNRGDIKGKILKHLEKGWEACGYSGSKKMNFRRFIDVAAVRCLMVMGKGRLGKMLFARTMKAFDLNGKETKVFIKRSGQKMKKFHSAYFQSSEEMKINGYSFTVPAETQKFLTKCYPKGKADSVKSFTYSNAVKLDDVPYERFLRICEEKGFDLKEFFKMRKANRARDAKVSGSMKIREKALLISKRSGDRLKFYEEFEKQKEIIQNLYIRKDFKELSKIFEECEQTTMFYLNKGLGFSVGGEYFDIQCALLEWKGKPKTLKKLRRLVPQEHYKPII